MSNKMVKVGAGEFDRDTVVKMVEAGLLTAPNIVRKNDPASLTPTRNVLNGIVQDGSGNIAGTFSGVGVRPERYSAMPRPFTFLRLLAENGGISVSEFEREILEIVTGQTASAGTNPTSWCGNPPEVGNLKTCRQIFTFGDYFIKTPLNALPVMGGLRDRAEQAGSIINTPAPNGNPFIPPEMYRLDDSRSQLQYALYTLGNDMERSFEQVGVNGIAGTMNSTYIGWMKQFAGIDAQIKTGYADVQTGVACPAADSDVQTFGAPISGNGVNGFNIVDALSYLFQGRQTVAGQVGMPDVDYVLMMRHDQFIALTDVWAYRYWNYNITGSVGNPSQVNSVEAQRMRGEMLRGQYLLINETPVRVVFSDGITRETVGNNQYNADILIVPVSVNGRPLLRLDFFNMDNKYIREFTAAFGLETTTSSMNNGMYLIGKRHNGFCLEYLFGARARLILETPFLAARLDNVQYSINGRTPLDAYPGQSHYRNGGISLRVFN